MATKRKTKPGTASAGARGGPKTQAGKAIVRLNAVTTGLVSSRPVLIVGVENVGDWQRHLATVRSELAPVGVVEQFLADTVALSSWRLLRAAGAEAAMIWARHTEAPDVVRWRPDAADNEDDDEVDEHYNRALEATAMECREFDRQDLTAPVDASKVIDVIDTLLDRLGREALHYELEPIDMLPPPRDWEAHDWTVAQLRIAITGISGWAPATAFITLAGKIDSFLAECTAKASAAEAVDEQADAEAKERAIAIHRAKRMLPRPEVLDSIGRHEAHLNRMMLKNLAALRDEQARRVCSAKREVRKSVKSVRPAGRSRRASKD